MEGSSPFPLCQTQADKHASVSSLHTQLKPPSFPTKDLGPHIAGLPNQACYLTKWSEVHSWESRAVCFVRGQSLTPQAWPAHVTFLVPRRSQRRYLGHKVLLVWRAWLVWHGLRLQKTVDFFHEDDRPSFQMACAEPSRPSIPMIGGSQRSTLYFLYVSVTPKDMSPQGHREKVFRLFIVSGRFFSWLGFGHWPGASVRDIPGPPPRMSPRLK